MNKQALGLRIKRLRDAKGLSQDALADRAGVARNGVNNIEQGRGNPTYETLEALANALGEPLFSIPTGANEPQVKVGFDERVLALLEVAVIGIDRTKLSEDQGKALRVFEDYLAGKGGLIVGPTEAAVYKEVMGKAIDANVKGHMDIWEKIASMTVDEQNVLRKQLGLKPRSPLKLKR